jgi:hypothetical protein
MLYTLLSNYNLSDCKAKVNEGGRQVIPAMTLMTRSTVLAASNETTSELLI